MNELALPVQSVPQLAIIDPTRLLGTGDLMAKPKPMFLYSLRHLGILSRGEFFKVIHEHCLPNLQGFDNYSRDRKKTIDVPAAECVVCGKEYDPAGATKKREATRKYIAEVEARWAANPPKPVIVPTDAVAKDDATAPVTEGDGESQSEITPA